MSDSEPLETEREQTPAPGERLRQAREAMKLSRQEVAERIRIDETRVAALEDDDLARVGAPVFAAGYIRAYARIVGLSADELIPQFAGLEQIETTPPAPLEDVNGRNLSARRKGARATRRATAGNRGAGRLVAGLLLLVIAAGTAWLLRDRLLPAPEAPLDAAHRDAGASALTIPGQAEYQPAESDLSDLDEATIAEEPPAAAVTSDDVMPEAEAPAVQSELSLSFTDDSWVEVYDARGERLLHRLGRAGSSHTIQGVAPFSLVLGYVPGVTILLDGEMVDLSRYQGRRLARFSVGDKAANEN